MNYITPSACHASGADIVSPDTPVNSHPPHFLRPSQSTLWWDVTLIDFELDWDTFEPVRHRGIRQVTSWHDVPIPRNYTFFKDQHHDSCKSMSYYHWKLTCNKNAPQTTIIHPTRNWTRVLMHRILNKLFIDAIHGQPQ